MPSSPKADRLPKIVLTIAGFDPSNGAGVTADLQVFAAHGLYGTAAITALTVQSTLGVASVEPVDAGVLRATLEHLTADLRQTGVKIGMLGSRKAVEAVAAFLRELSDVVNGDYIPVVLDPVLRSTSGAELLPADAMDTLHHELLPLVSWLTPNFKELHKLDHGLHADLLSAIEHLGNRFPRLHIVATAGDEQGPPTDVLRFPDGTIKHFEGERIETQSTHGTGCAFSSALLSQLVCGRTGAEAVRLAKSYVETAMRLAPGVGHGHGPLNLLWPLRDC